MNPKYLEFISYFLAGFIITVSLSKGELRRQFLRLIFGLYCCYPLLWTILIIIAIASIIQFVCKPFY